MLSDNSVPIVPNVGAGSSSLLMTGKEEKFDKNMKAALTLANAITEGPLDKCATQALLKAALDKGVDGEETENYAANEYELKTTLPDGTSAVIHVQQKVRLGNQLPESKVKLEEMKYLAMAEAEKAKAAVAKAEAEKAKAEAKQAQLKKAEADAAKAKAEAEKEKAEAAKAAAEAAAEAAKKWCRMM